MMKFIYTDTNFLELGYLDEINLDIEIGKYTVSNNDFEVTLSLMLYDHNFTEGSLFYSENTEWGGLVGSKKVDTANNTITLKGKTFRGLLEKEYIQPPTNQAYFTFTGEANELLRQLIGDRFGDFVTVDDIDTGINVNVSIRDMNLLDAIERNLKTYNLKLEVVFYENQVHIQAKPIDDISELIQYDNSYGLTMVAETAPMPYNHVLALGKGELTARERMNFYYSNGWVTTPTDENSGLNRKTYKYDNPNVQPGELANESLAKVNEVNGTSKLTINLSGDEVELFDIVGAKEEITGLNLKEQITGKILKGSIKGNIELLKIEYKIGE